MKKILFLMQFPPPVHGASVVNKTISENEFINACFDAEYVDISPASEMDDLGQITFRKVLVTTKIYFIAIKRYLKIKPSLVYLTLSPHGAAFYKDGLLAIFLKLLGANLVFHMHGKGIAEEANKSIFKKTLYSLVFKRVDVIHLSKSLFYDVDPVRDFTRELIAVPNSVPSPPEVSVKKNDHSVTFIYLSNIMRIKGVDTLIRAASLIPASFQKRFEVKIIGKTESQEYMKEVEELLSKSHYDNLTYLGPRYGSDKYHELFKSDVFVLPTKNDCFPLTILEAMSSSLTVISTNMGAITDIVDDGVTGVVLDECTPNRLADVMLDFIKNPEKCVKYGAAGREEYQAKYTPEVFERNLVCSLERVIQKNEQRRSGSV
ncbi:glycosyltransferase family 4 protein [Oceanisphaera sp.]|uniref:glycosyltransferase family 4 protein n=1 Tax=Oceanisphaera sp. TaxID=1929979 RepID=UPI003A9567AE